MLYLFKEVIMIYSFIKENEVEFTESEQQLLRDYYMYALEYYNDDSEEIEVTTEGTNIDILKALNAGLKSYKADLKEVKKAIKAGDAKTAKEKIKSARATIEETKKTIRKIPEDVESAVIGVAINMVITMIYLIFPTFSIKIGKKSNFWLGLAAAAVEVPATLLFSEFTLTLKGIAKLIRITLEMGEEAKKGAADIRIFNQFRLHCLSCLTQCGEILDIFEKKIK